MVLEQNRTECWRHLLPTPNSRLQVQLCNRSSAPQYEAAVLGDATMGGHAAGVVVNLWPTIKLVRVQRWYWPKVKTGGINQSKIWCVHLLPQMIRPPYFECSLNQTHFQKMQTHCLQRTVTICNLWFASNWVKTNLVYWPTSRSNYSLLGW